MRRIRATPAGGGRADWPADLRLDCHKSHSGHSDVYGRMHWDGPAPVLTTKCTSISNGRYGHPEQEVVPQLVELEVAVLPPRPVPLGP
jgi:DNA (cytosine-5)-methyltransferase 1